MSKRRGVTEFLSIFQDVGATFFDIESDLLIVLDKDGNIDRINPAFEKALNRTEAEVLGMGIIRFVMVDDWAKFIRGFSATHPEAVRMLCKESGEIMVRLVACRFKAGRGFIVLRKVTG